MRARSFSDCEQHRPRSPGFQDIADIPDQRFAGQPCRQTAKDVAFECVGVYDIYPAFCQRTTDTPHGLQALSSSRCPPPQAPQVISTLTGKRLCSREDDTRLQRVQVHISQPLCAFSMQ